jgi:hypothetical protein
LSAAAAVFVLSFPISFTVGYLLLAMTSRHGDSPWIAFLIAAATWLGVFLFALSIAV